MGIKNLKKFLQDKAPQAFFNAPLSLFHNKRIAIDTNNLMIRYFSIAQKKVLERRRDVMNQLDNDDVHPSWFTMIFDFIRKLIRAKIIPVFVFDGKHPQEKSKTTKKRKELRKKQEEEIFQEREKFSNLDILDLNDDIVNNIIRKQANLIRLRSEDYEEFRAFLRNLGMPVLMAEGEGEKLCSSLCIEGKVAAVFSADIDNVAHGCPVVITDFSKESIDRQPAVCCIRYDKIIESLALSPETFLDLCVMCGTDYNESIPQIGPVRAYNLLKQYHSIDHFPYNIQIECLDHRNTRSLFSYVASSELCPGMCLDWISPNPEQRMEQHFRLMEKDGNYNVDPVHEFNVLETLEMTLGQPTELQITNYSPIKIDKREHRILTRNCYLVNYETKS